MKWTQKGHELDDLGAKYMRIRNVYIWGAGKYGQRILKTLLWLHLGNDFIITFVDSYPRWFGGSYETKKVISPLSFIENFNKTTDVLVISSEQLYHIIKESSKESIPETFFIGYAERMPDFDFQRRFLSVYMMYKYNKLISPHSNYIVTTRCNLNCKGCLNFTEFIQNPADQTFDDFRKHIDIVFSKFDYISSMHFSGGEVLLNKAVSKMLRYMYDNYGDKIFEIFLVTNGTILINEVLLDVMKYTRCGVLLDDYRESTSKACGTYPKIKELLDKNNIWYSIAKAEHWYDLSINNDRTIGSDLTEEYLIKHIAECNVHYFQDFFDGKLFGCCYIGYTNDMYPNKAWLYTPDPDNDYIEIEKSTKMEILEYRFGYTNKGYYDLCRRCNEMHGKASVFIPVAEQIIKEE